MIQLPLARPSAELNIPRAAVLVSIQRGEETIIPRGDTILQCGDVVTTLCERDTIPSVRRLLLESDRPKNIDPLKPRSTDE